MLRSRPNPGYPARIGLIHATRLAIEPALAAFQEAWPAAHPVNLVDESLQLDAANTDYDGPSFTQRILALAAGIPHIGRLEDPHGSAMKRSPLCGSTVTVDLMVEDGKIANFAQDVKACALGQSSASVLGAHAVGRTRAEIEAARAQLKAMIKQDGPAPETPFEDLEVLRPARDYKNRHASILLAWEATLAAMDEAAVADG